MDSTKNLCDVAVEIKPLPGLNLFVVPAIYLYIYTEGVKMVEIEKHMEKAMKEAGSLVCGVASND